MKNYSKTIGDIGESLVLKYLKSLNYDAVLSDDEFDEVCDIYINKGTKDEIQIEVKTQLPKVFGYDREGKRAEVFTIHTTRGCDGLKRKSQKKKANKAVVFFVQIPYMNRQQIKIYQKPQHIKWIKNKNEVEKSKTLEIAIKDCKYLYSYDRSEIPNEYYDFRYESLKQMFKTAPNWEYKP